MSLPKDKLLPFLWATAFCHMDTEKPLRKPEADLFEFTPCCFIYGSFHFQKTPGHLVHMSRSSWC